MHFCFFIIISPWKRTGPFIWTHVGSFHPKMLCAKFSWNWSCVVLEKKIIFYFLNVLLLFRNSPLGKGQGPPFEQTRISLTQRCFEASLVEIDPLVLEKKMNMWKVYDNKNDAADDNDDGQSSLEPSAQVS